MEDGYESVFIVGLFIAFIWGGFYLASHVDEDMANIKLEREIEIQKCLKGGESRYACNFYTTHTRMR